ncbi:MAG: hypothetical protein E7490_07800 [Ruminococcaceae bacterium]|nr:hypothetical protein [Oscillospiraceae bacterium]
MKKIIKIFSITMLALSVIFTLCACSQQTVESNSEEELIWKDVTFDKTFYLDGDTSKQHIVFNQDGTMTFEGFDYDAYCEKAYTDIFPEQVSWLADKMEEGYDYMYHKGDEMIFINLFQGIEDFSFLTTIAYDRDVNSIVFGAETYKEV